MKIKTFIFSASVAFLAGMTSCSNDEPMQNSGDDILKWEFSPVPSGFNPIIIPEEGAGVSESERDFSFRFFKEAALKDSYSNTVVSPLNLFLHLGILANADSGETRDEILRVLGMEDSPESFQSLNVYSEYLLRDLPDLDSQTKFVFSSSFWHSPEIGFQKDFQDRITIFGTDFYNESPSNANSLVKINGWINNKTGGLIPKFFDSPVNTDLLLLNTTLFVGLWHKKFSAENTHPSKFTCMNGKEVTTSFMARAYDGAPYYNADGIVGTSLEFGSGNFSLMLLMPANMDTDLGIMIENLDLKTYKDLKASTKDVILKLELPKFESKFKDEMNDVFKSMGLNSLFNRGFDSFLSHNKNKVIGQHFHGVSFSIDEEGAKAAAVDASTFVDGAGPIPEREKIELKFNRPFIYILRETSTGTVLFMGCVTKF